VALLLLMMAGCDNATSPNQDLTSSYDLPETMQSGDAINTTIDELPIYTVPGFYFLAPMVKGSEYSGTFDAGLSPVVEICETTACAAIHESFDMDGEGSERVRLDEEDEHYIVNWHTDQTGTEVGQTYRIRVSVAGTVLAHADIQMAENGRDAKNITDDEAIALVDGRTLPIKFRVEEGAVYVTDSGGGTIISEDGLVTLEIPENAIDGEIGITISSAMDELDDEDVIPGTLFDFGPSPFTFNEPVILTIIFDPANLPAGVSEDELRLLAVVDGEWVQLPGSSVDLSNSTVTGPLDSFSRKGVGRGKVSEIFVTPADASLEVGGTQQFEATVTNVDGEEMDRNVRWSSSDDGIATVDGSGLAAAVALGDVEIEARSGKVAGTADLTVEVTGPVVTTITVSPAEATITEGSTAQFTATVYDQNDEVMDDETVFWTSSNESIATVNENGLATGLNEGESTIIATIGAIYGNAIIIVTGQDNSAFITTWDTSLGSNSSVTLGLTGNVDATIYWGDGTNTVVNTPGPHTHAYEIDGIYTVSVTGVVTGYDSNLSNFSNRQANKLISVDSWGQVGFTNMSHAFYNARNLTSVPNHTNGLESVTNMQAMFHSAIAFNGDISGWDTGNVTDMSYMFRSTSVFNGDIGGWDTGNVISMSNMFERTRAFNKNLSSWNTSNVTQMSSMFEDASAFNGDIGAWDTGNVKTMERMFSRTRVFNKDISGWNTSHVNNMESMFYWASAFNGDIGGWDTGNVKTMKRMFSVNNSFNQDIGGWDTGNVTQMDFMFLQAAFNGDIGDWDTGNVKNMESMFRGARYFNQDIGRWDTGNVTSMDKMFEDARAFNKDIGSWNTSNVTNMASMFRSAWVFNQNLNNWDTGNVTDMLGMFQNALAFNGNISNWNTANVIGMGGMFANAKSFNQPMEDWDTGNVRSMISMFRNAEIFDGNIGAWNTGNVRDMSSMFRDATSFNQYIGGWDTGLVTNMREMFRDAATFNRDLSGWCVSNFDSMPSRFDTGATSWELPRPVWGTCPD